MYSFKGFYCLEDVDSEFISCQIFDKVPKNESYKYFIGQLGMDGFCPRAFRTASGFKQFLKVYDLKKTKREIEHLVNFNGEKSIYFYLKGKFKVVSFWHKTDLPKGVKHFIGLENGSYVDCYYTNIDGIRVIFKPNPNAKDVYKPYDHFSCVKKYG